MNVIEVFVNGDIIQLPAESNVGDLLQILKLSPDRVAVELNKTLVRKRDWSVTAITGGARLEVVEFVGGG